MRPFKTFSLCIVSASLLMVAQSAHAVGGDDDTPPAKTQTTNDCFTERQWDPDIQKYVRYSEKVNGVWDANLKRCIRPDKAGYLKSEVLQDAVRELAYAGRINEAQQLLSQLEPTSDFALTYWGFTHRKLGNNETSDMFYEAALKQNPDNVLARSYMGQGLVAHGDVASALVQLREIRARGGQDTWAEASLVKAIATGKTYDY